MFDSCSLHLQSLVEDRDAQYGNVSLLFNTTEEDNVHAVTLNGLLDKESSDYYKNETTTTSEESPLSPSLTYGYSCEDHARSSLERSTMKGTKRKLKEFPVTEDALLPVGTSVGVRHFVPEQYIGVTGISRGKGF